MKSIGLEISKKFDFGGFLVVGGEEKKQKSLKAFITILTIEPLTMTSSLI